LESDKNKTNIDSGKSYLKYSGIAFQLVALVLLSFYLGRWVDDKLGNSHPFIGMTALVVVFVAFIYKLYKELFK
jgi:ATP synthase protein I